MSTLKTVNVVHPSSSTNNIVTDANGNVTVGGTVSMASSFLRNRVINGAMEIDQRNAGAEVNPAVNAEYYLDRWNAISGAASKFKIGQNAGSVTPPAGFKNYLGVTSLSSYSVGASEGFGVRQTIEGFNIVDLAWGTANAKPITISFWVRSSLTGTFGLGVLNSAVNRSYPASYTISAANTWEYKTVTIPGDTTGTWLTSNDIGIRVTWQFGYGSSISGTANAWNAGTVFAPTGAVSIVGTNGATFYLTGVQLEVGSVATPFERRLYTTELQLCQRYYQLLTSQLVYGVTSSSGNQLIECIALPVAMRAGPTVSYTLLTSNLRSSGPTTNSATATTLRTAMVTSGGGSAYVDFDAKLEIEL